MKLKNIFSLKTLTISTVLSMSFLYSCKKDNEGLNSSDSQIANSESVSSFTSSETSDLGNSVISNVSNTRLSSSRVSSEVTGLGLKDRRLLGATVTIVGTGTADSPSGSIIIDYGTGVTTDGVIRKGQIIIAYSGRRLQPGSTRTITFNDYHRNAIKVDGAYNVTVTDSTLTSSNLTVTFDNVTTLTLTFPDKTTFTRNATFSEVWDYNINTPSLSTISHKSGGSAEGATRSGLIYSISIVSDIVQRAECFTSGFSLPVSGTKTIVVVNGKMYGINYGSGTCDNAMAVTVGNSKVVTVTVSASGN